MQISYEVQLAIMKGKYNLDDIVITIKMLDVANKLKQEFILFYVDVDKSYDSHDAFI